MLTFKLELSLP